MVRVIMGVKGTGKTKQMIELINSAVHSENGNVVCIERGPKLTYDIHYKIRLVEASQYDMSSYDFLKGFISGLYAGNYDITHIFIDSLTKIVASEATDHAVEEFLDWLNSFSEKNNIKFTVTISADASLATEGIKKYFFTPSVARLASALMVTVNLMLFFSPKVLSQSRKSSTAASPGSEGTILVRLSMKMWVIS